MIAADIFIIKNNNLLCQLLEDKEIKQLIYEAFQAGIDHQKQIQEDQIGDEDDVIDAGDFMEELIETINLKTFK